MAPDPRQVPRYGDDGPGGVLCPGDDGLSNLEGRRRLEHVQPIAQPAQLGVTIGRQIGELLDLLADPSLELGHPVFQPRDARDRVVSLGLDILESTRPGDGLRALRVRVLQFDQALSKRSGHQVAEHILIGDSQPGAKIIDSVGRRRFRLGTGGYVGQVGAWGQDLVHALDDQRTMGAVGERSVQRHRLGDLTASVSERAQ